LTIVPAIGYILKVLKPYFIFVWKV